MITSLKWGMFFYLLLVVYFIFSYRKRLVCWTYMRHKSKRLENPIKNRIALVIPARNESASIPALFKSIEEQTYDRDMFDIHVIVADPEDKTIALTQKENGYVYVAPDQKCKGDALDHAFKKILSDDPEKYDAYIVIDADCVLDKNFVSEMNNALASGKEIITSKKLVKNYFFGKKSEKKLSCACNGLIWTLIDNLGNSYKSSHNMPCFIVGTGFMLTKKVMKELGGWCYRETLTEDVELMMDSVIRGYSSFYYEYAILYMEEAPDLETTDKRRKRWMTGVVDSTRIYSERLEREAQNGKEDEVFHVVSLKKVYKLIGFSVLFAFSNFFFSVLLALSQNEAWRYALNNAIVGALVIYSSFFIMTLLAIIADYENIKLPFYKKLILLFVHPIFYMKYIEIVAHAYINRSERSWEEIKRIELEDEDESEKYPEGNKYGK